MITKKPKPKRRRKINIGHFLNRYFVYFIVLVVAVVGVVATIKIYSNRNQSVETNPGISSNLILAENYALAMYEPVSFNALTSSDEDVVYLNNVIYSSLFRLDDTLNITPDIVSDYSVNSETGTVDLELKDNVGFSNGISLTAEDVDFTITTIKEIGKASPYFSYVDKIGTVTVTGTFSLTIRFSNLNNASLDNLVFPIVSRDSYRKSQDFAIGSGAYSYSSYEEGRSVELKPNPYYHNNPTDYPVEIVLVKDKSMIPGLITMDAVTAFLSKDPGMDTVARDKSLKYIPVVSGEMEYLGFNCKNSFLSDGNIRRAIAGAINQDRIINDDYSGNAVVSDSIYYPGFLGSDVNDGVKFEPKTSSDILVENGYRDVDEDGVLENEEGEDIILKIIVNSNNNNRTEAAHSIAEDLSAIGIDVDVAELSKEEYQAALRTGDYGLYLAGINVDKQFNLTELYTSANYGGFKGDKILELTKELEKTYTADEYKRIFASLKGELYKEMPYYAICYKTYSFLAVNSLDTKVQPQFYNPYRGLEQWSWMKRGR